MSSWLDIRTRKTSDPQAQLIAKIIQRQLRVTASETQITDQGPRRLMRTLFDQAVTKDDPYFNAILRQKTAGNFRLPFEPDGDLLRLWLKFDTGGNSLIDYSGFGDKNISKFVTPIATKALTLYKGPYDGISGGELCSLFNGVDQAIRVSDAGFEASEGQNSNIEISSFNTSTYQGFTIWCRFIPLRLGTDIHNKNRTLFFKTDEDSISNGYTAQIDPSGNVLFFVKLNNVVYSAWASAAVTAETFGPYSSANYNPRNYITDIDFEPDTSAASFIDLTFTFTFATNAMKIFKNGVDVTAAGNLPAGSDPNFPGEFVPGTPPPSNEFVQVYNVPKGIETDYTAYLSAPSGPTPEFTKVYDVPVPSGGTGGGGYTDQYGPVTGDQYWNLDGAGGGGGGYTDVYNVAQGSSYVNLDGTRIRNGEVFASGSALIGDIITQAVFILSKTGSPSGTGSVVIRKGTDDSIAATIGTIDVSTITTSYASYTFTNDSNSYAIAANDRIMFEHSGGTTSSYVTVNRQGSDVFDGTNSYAASYDDVGSYHDSTTRDCAGVYRTGSGSGVGGGSRCGERCTGASSSLIGEIITQVELILKKTGAPTGTASVVIRKESDDSIAATIGTLDVTTLTGTDQTKIFTNDSNTYALGQGDKILIEHSGGNSTNYVSVKRTSLDAFDGTNTCFTSYKTALPYTDDSTKDVAGTFRSGTTGGGGGGYYTDVYNIPAGSSYVALDGTRIRGGEIIANTSSSLYGKKITQVDAILSKTGSPTGNASIVIRRGSDDSIAVTIGTIDVTTLSTSYGVKTVTNNANTYALQVGDKIMIEYSGGTTSNYISINRNTTTLFDGGVNTYWASYDGSAYHNFTDRSMAAVFRVGAGSSTLQYGNLDNNTQRQAIYLATAQSALIGKTITKVNVFLKKVGSPTGTLYVRLVKGIDGTFASTIGTLDVATIPSGTIVDYGFMLLTNVYTLQQGDYVALYYNNGTASNYVQTVSNDDVFDGANTTKASFSSAGVWSYQSANDLCGQLYTGGGSAPPPPPPPPPDTYPTKDAFGVHKIYVDDPAKIEQTWLMGNTNLGSDPRVRVDGSMQRVSDGIYQISGSSVRINVYTTNPNASDVNLQRVIGNDWTQRLQKGYTLDTFDWRDFELTTYWKVLTWNGGTDEMSIYGRGGRHTDGWPDACLSTDYKGQIQTPGNARFAKEYHHQSGSNGYAFNPGTRYFTVPSTTNVWIGQKTVVYDVFDPQTNQTFVKVEVWVDTEGGEDITKQNWRLMAEITDKGSWGEPSNTDYYTQCNSPNHQQIMLWGGPSVVFRVDNVTVQHKRTSARPIKSTRASSTQQQQQQQLMRLQQPQQQQQQPQALIAQPKLDWFGVQKIYDDMPFPYNSWHITTANDPRFFEETPVDIGNGWFRYQSNDQGRIEVLPEAGLTEGDIDTYDYAQVIQKGYLHLPSNDSSGHGDWGDIEMTVAYRNINLGSGSYEAHPELVRGGFRQSTSNTPAGKDGVVVVSCEAMSYHANIYLQESDGGSNRCKYEKDTKHTDGYTVESSNPVWRGVMSGLNATTGFIHKAVFYKVPNASVLGGYAMKMEQYVSTDGLEGKDFRLIGEYLDDGHWGPTKSGVADDCGCPNEYPVHSQSVCAPGIRIDFMDSFEFAKFSIRSIDRTKKVYPLTEEPEPQQPANVVYHGAMVDTNCTENVTAAQIDTFNTYATKNIAICFFSDNWWDGIHFPLAECNICKSKNAVPFIRMQTWASEGNQLSNMGQYTHANIIDGQHDTALRQYAQAAKAFSSIIFIEYGVEVNGDWFPWSLEGPTPYKNAYTHIINLFREEGVTNVRWGFHIDATDNNNGSQWYPGDNYIDWVGSSMYGVYGYGQQGCLSELEKCWSAFSAISTTKPLAILEWGQADAADTTSALNAIATNTTYERIRMMNVWNEPLCDESDPYPPTGVIWSNQDNLIAYRNGISNPRFASVYQEEVTPPPPEPPPSPISLGRSRVGIELNTNNITLRGKKITKAQFWLKKVGNPTGILSCVIRRGTDDSIRTVLGTILAASISSVQNTLYTFANTSAVNTYTLQPYDKISLEYSAGDTNNKVYVLQNDSVTTDCFEFDYDGTVYRSTVAKDVCGNLFTGGEPYSGDMPPESYELPDYIHDLICASGRGVQSGFANVIFAEIRLYRKALSVAESLALYQNRITIKTDMTYGNIGKIGFSSISSG